MQDPIHLDEQTGSVEFRGAAGAQLLYAFLLKAKFGEAFDPEMLLNAKASALLSKLSAFTPGAKLRDQYRAPFDERDLIAMARHVVHEAKHSKWWEKNAKQQIEFLQGVVAAPYQLNPDQVTFILDSIQDEVRACERVARAASPGGGDVT